MQRCGWLDSSFGSCGSRTGPHCEPTTWMRPDPTITTHAGISALMLISWARHRDHTLCLSHKDIMDSTEGQPDLQSNYEEREAITLQEIKKLQAQALTSMNKTGNSFYEYLANPDRRYWRPERMRNDTIPRVEQNVGNSLIIWTLLLISFSDTKPSNPERYSTSHPPPLKQLLISLRHHPLGAIRVADWAELEQVESLDTVGSHEKVNCYSMVFSTCPQRWQND